MFREELEERGILLDTSNRDEVFAEIARFLAQSVNAQLVWRGQTNIDWPLVPSLYRRLREAPDFLSEERDRVLMHEAELIRRALELNYVHGDPLTALATLQHHGAATRLLDVTTDPMIALWFAVADDKARDVDGILYMFDRGGCLPVDRDDQYAFLANSRVAYVDLPPNGARQEHQRAGYLLPPYLCGDSSDVTDQFVPDKGRVKSHSANDKDAFPAIAAIKVPASEKSAVRSILASSLGLHQDRIYPDLQGFCAANNVDSVVSPPKVDFRLSYEARDAVDKDALRPTLCVSKGEITRQAFGKSRKIEGVLSVAPEAWKLFTEQKKILAEIGPTEPAAKPGGFGVSRIRVLEVTPDGSITSVFEVSEASYEVDALFVKCVISEDAGELIGSRIGFGGDLPLLGFTDNGH